MKIYLDVDSRNDIKVEDSKCQREKNIGILAKEIYKKYGSLKLDQIEISILKCKI